MCSSTMPASSVGARSRTCNARPDPRGLPLRRVLTPARSDLNDTFNVNVAGPHTMIQAFLPLLRKGAMKKIVNM